jgi:hypothetical protein
MTERQAMFFICDDVLIALNGKYTVSGIYTGDIIINQDPTQLLQLVVMFEIRTPIDNPFRTLVLHVSLPGEESPRRLELPPFPSPPKLPERTAILHRFPFLITNPILRSGPIEVKVLHEEGELSAGKQWVVTVQQAQAMVTAQQAVAH